MKAEKNSKLEKGLVREFIDINEVNEKLKYNDVKVMLDAESLYRGQLFRLAQKVLKIKLIIELTKVFLNFKKISDNTN